MELIILNCFLITFVITVIWDISGFITDLTRIIYEKLNNKPWFGQQLPKPLSCSLCMSFWIILIYLLFNVQLLYALSIACAFIFIQIVIKIILKKINNKLNKKLYDEN